jgi:hypothetical protein
MIFAIDHDAGTRIMESIYGNAARRVPQMQKEAPDRAPGQLALDVGLEPLTRATATSRPRSRGLDPRVFEHAPS